MGDHLGTRVITGSKDPAIAGYPGYGGAPFVLCCPPSPMFINNRIRNHVAIPCPRTVAWTPSYVCDPAIVVTSSSSAAERLGMGTGTTMVFQARERDAEVIKGNAGAKAARPRPTTPTSKIGVGACARFSPSSQRSDESF